MWEFYRAFKKCIIRRGENRLFRDIIIIISLVSVLVVLFKGYRNGVFGVLFRKMSVRGFFVIFSLIVF